MNHYQSSAIDIPPKTTRIVASTTSDGHTMLSSIITDGHGHQVRRNSTCTDTGISPTYYTSSGTPIHTQSDKSHSVGSPVYGDQSRIFFSHSSECSCKRV